MKTITLLMTQDKSELFVLNACVEGRGLGISILTFLRYNNTIFIIVHTGSTNCMQCSFYITCEVVIFHGTKSEKKSINNVLHTLMIHENLLVNSRHIKINNAGEMSSPCVISVTIVLPS